MLKYKVIKVSSGGTCVLYMLAPVNHDTVYIQYYM